MKLTHVIYRYKIMFLILKKGINDIHILYTFSHKSFTYDTAYKGNIFKRILKSSNGQNTLNLTCAIHTYKCAFPIKKKYA